jgi:hypothetical protein
MWLLFGLLLGTRGGLDVGPHGCLDRLLVGLIFGLPILWGVGLGCWSKSSLKSGLITGLIGGLRDPESGLIFGLISVLFYGLMAGLIGGLGVGSLAHSPGAR